MELSTFLSLLAAVVGFVASCFFAKGAICMTAEKTFKVSSTYWDWNREWGHSIADQRADYTVGGLLLLASFVLQLLAILVPSIVRLSLLVPCGYAILAVCAFAAVLLLSACCLRARIAYGTKIKMLRLRRSNQEQDPEPSASPEDRRS